MHHGQISLMGLFDWPELQTVSVRIDFDKVHCAVFIIDGTSVESLTLVLKLRFIIKCS